jgi:hypoxanthine phosphoribosyltransferase
LVSEFGFEVPTWNGIYRMLLELADKVRANNFKPDILIGISRGGWLPTRVLSDLLENPCITSVGAAFYVGLYETNHEPILTHPLSISALNKKILLVDDVVDTGKSAMLIRSHIDREGAKEIRLLTLYYKPWSIVIPDFYSKETKDWIVFPWEIKETLRKLRKKYKGKTKLFMKAKSELVSCGIDKELIERLLE